MLILNKRLLRRVLLATFISDLFVFFGHFTLFELIELRLVLLARGGLIFTFGIQFALKYLSMGQLMWVISQRVIPTWSRVQVCC